MANFATHITVGMLVSAAGATLTMAANVVTPTELVTLALTGAFGSVLPDVDLEKSRPSEAIFLGLALFLAFAVLFKIGFAYSIVEMWMIWLGTFFGVRYLAHAVFHRITHHRGIFHSLLASVFFGVVTAVLFFHLFNAPAALSWLAGLFMMLGYLTHLVLDEIYSVDVYNERIKASFGTALKPIDFDHLGASASMVAALALACWLAPAPWTFIDAFRAADVASLLNDHLLPKDHNWFGLGASLQHLASVLTKR
jgi:LexA-binding, inner membrane-associated putative hydrolase